MTTSHFADPYRPALYYPYIHIHDENWLKGAILGFQQVRRMVPLEFTVKDAHITRPYAELVGPAGPLLEPLTVDGSEIRNSQEWLRQRIFQHLAQVKAAYSHDQTPTEQRGGAAAFEIHKGKFLDGGLLELLMKEGLGWYSREATEANPLDWVTMHPTLGAAVMSVLALSAARGHGLSIVTPSRRTHAELLANQEEYVFDRLLGLAKPAPSQDPVHVEELAQIVITTGFDLTRLNPEDILNLIKEGKDLRSFRAKVAEFASQIPEGVSYEERTRRLKVQAEAVLAEWQSYTKGLPRFAELAKSQTWEKAPEKLAQSILAGASTGDISAGALTFTVLGAVPGLIVGIVVAAGVKMYRGEEMPLRFLNRVNELANERIGSLYAPQWRSLAAQSGS